eukprot:m.48145 g.48145  ORF g.48145 m.48145 type:complete len:625 (-) comp6404_c0_seq2:251-2125(-)
MRRLSALVFIASVVSVALAAVDWAAYEQLCGDIVRNAQLAARAHNGGDAAAEKAALAAARAAYISAVQMAPAEPQAHANMATFLHNTHQFEEAVAVWDRAIGTVGDPSMRAMLSERRTQALIGGLSTRRDKAYAGGQGDVLAALALAKEQRTVRESPDVVFDIATMQVMASETDPALAAAADKNFRRAQDLAFGAWVSGRRRMGDSCKESNLVRSWTVEEHAGLAVALTVSGTRTYGKRAALAYDSTQESLVAVDLEFHEGGSYIAEFKSVQLHGPDGLIVQTSSNFCRLFVPSTGIYVNLLNNVQVLADWATPAGAKANWFDAHHGRFPNHGMSREKAVQLKEAVSIVQFTTLSFYHWLTEALGRLVLLRPVLEANPDAKIIVPRDASGNGFVTQYLDLLPFVTPDRLVYYDTNGPPDVQMSVRTLWYANWNPVWHADHLVHSVAPQSVLQLLRDTLAPLEDEDAGDKDSSQKATRRRSSTILFLSRAGEKMRHLRGEGRLFNKLHAALPSNFRIVPYDAKTTSVKDTIKLFRSARAVVGVHGGAFANTLYCAPATQIFELGFRAPHTRHYAHLAQALDLDYHLYYLNADPRGLGADRVDISDAAIDHIVTALLAGNARHDEL